MKPRDDESANMAPQRHYAHASAPRWPALYTLACLVLLLNPATVWAGTLGANEVATGWPVVEYPPLPPNIVLVLTDDQDQLLGSLDFLPLLRQYVRDPGVTFTNFFVPGPLCCPSRASILRGQYLHGTGIWSNSSPDGGWQVFRALGHESSTIASWLYDAAYRTVLLGKYLNGYPGQEPTYVPPGWSEWYGVTTGHFFNYYLNENGVLVYYGNRPEDYETDVLSRKAVDFIIRAARDRVPFFIYLTPFAPHAPATPAPRHANLFPNEKAPRTPSFNEADVSDKPRHIRNLSLLTPQEIAQLDEHHRNRLRSLQAVDEMVRDVVLTLQSTGTLDNTYVFYTSDNGFHLGQHRLRAGKAEPYEEDIRVPLIVRGPGVPAGRTLEYLASNVDLAPTFTQLANAPTPSFVDGRSLVPLLGNQAPGQPWRRGTLVELFSGQVHFDLVRTADYKYVERAWGERELYHLLSDPYELLSLHNRGFERVIVRLAAWLRLLRNCKGAGCPKVENPLPADVTGDLCVKGDDLQRVQDRQGKICYGCPEDLNNDWLVDQQDVDLVVQSFGHGCPGDLNCDGVTNNFDIDPFALALANPAAYRQQYPYCLLVNADTNGDGLVNNFDIDPFVKLLVP